MYRRMRGLKNAPKIISNEDFQSLDAAMKWFYTAVQDGGEVTAFDKSSSFKGELKADKVAREIAEYNEALEEYEKSPHNLNRVINQHYTD